MRTRYRTMALIRSQRDEVNGWTEHLFQHIKGHFYVEIDLDDHGWCCSNGGTPKTALARARGEAMCKEDDDQGLPWMTEDDCRDELDTGP